MSSTPGTREALIGAQPYETEIDLGTLSQRGFSLARSAGRDPYHMLQACGRILGGETEIATLDQDSSPDPLPIHTEMIYRSQPLKYFLLACLEPSLSGGSTCVYDARAAARMVVDEAPELAKVEIDYKSSFGSHNAKHYLVETIGEISTLRFRSRVSANHIGDLPEGWSESRLYSYLGELISRCEILDHYWEAGDILVVDNDITLHSRKPFIGRRVMLRGRVESNAAES